ncbi:MAG: thiamine diphosphokinase [Candidatus Promineifilaceae bacterium]|nr:thiamine diphosphokinase [Anaerolineaceae bacterium]
MTLLIFANGVLDEVAWIRPYFAQATAVWAADGGSKHLFRLGHLPNRVIGDMDSLEPEIQAWLTENQVPFDHHPPEKDETDLELALLLAAGQPDDQIWLFGLLGGRLDQMLANIFLLTNPALAEKHLQLVTPTERAWLVRPQTETEIVGRVGDMVSLIPLAGDAHGVTATGLQWPLQNETLQFGQARGVSNRLTAEKASVQVNNGLLLCVQTVGG